MPSPLMSIKQLTFIWSFAMKRRNTRYGFRFIFYQYMAKCMAVYSALPSHTRQRKREIERKRSNTPHRAAYAMAILFLFFSFSFCLCLSHFKSQQNQQQIQKSQQTATTKTLTMCVYIVFFFVDWRNDMQYEYISRASPGIIYIRCVNL